MPWQQCPACSAWVKPADWIRPDLFRLRCPHCSHECDIADPVYLLRLPDET